MASSRAVQAAGALLYRETDDGLLIAVVHRDRYDDWSLPKGKVHPGESELLAALRETSEETGARAAASRRIGRVRYRVDGRPKVVRYWAMRYLDGEFAPSPEVDRIEWLPVEQAGRRMTYDTDRSMLEVLATSTQPTSMVILVRHARAGKRSVWKGPDALRPLDVAGRRQAAALLPLMGAFDPVRVLSAPPLRCVQTVEPLADCVGLTVEIDAAYGDDGFQRRPAATVAAFNAVLEAGRDTLVCSQGEAIPGLIDQLHLMRPGASSTAKGAFWALGCHDGSVVSADYYRVRTTSDGSNASGCKDEPERKDPGADQPKS